ncbi:MAG: hypothetical protein TREMPRED_002243 [Tremellales sp. Tagirdzhanova-0007]|nr:MAG: hypothetical protein TREMPRED_002243 [Tremellales sp. Tagirdzhanova-0007]
MKYLDHSPTAGETLRSRETVDGKKRHAFFSPELAHNRKEWAKLALPTFALVTVFMFLFLSIYFGSYYSQIPRATHFSIEVIDLDSLASPSGSAAHPAILGPAIRTAITEADTIEPHLGWYEADASTLQTFRLTPTGQGMDVYDYSVDKVNNQDVWAVMIINANATSGVWASVTSGAAWDPTGAITFIYEEARNFYATDQYVSRLGLELMTAATSSADTTLASQVLALGNATAVLSAAPPSSVIGAFSFNMHNLHPFDQTGGIPATTIGTVYLIIFTFLISVSWNNLGLPLIQEKLSLGSEVLIKIVIPFLGTVLLSLLLAIPPLLARFPGLPNFIHMSALGFVMETVFLWLGPFFPFFLIFWVIINVSVAFLDIGDAPTFYRYGFSLPVWNLVDAAKSIIFATKDHVTQNLAVELAWMFVWMILLGITVVLQRRKKEAARMKAKWDEMKGADEKASGREKGHE